MLKLLQAPNGRASPGLRCGIVLLALRLAGVDIFAMLTGKHNISGVAKRSLAVKLFVLSLENSSSDTTYLAARSLGYP